MHRSAAAAIFTLLLTTACGGSSGTASPLKTVSPSAVASVAASPAAITTPNPAGVIFDHSQTVMVTLCYTVHRQWLKPQAQAVLPASWKAG